MSRWPGVFTALSLASLGCLIAGAVYHSKITSPDGVDTAVIGAYEITMAGLFLTGGLCLAALVGCVVHVSQRPLGQFFTAGYRREAAERAAAERAAAEQLATESWPS